MYSRRGRNAFQSLSRREKQEVGAFPPATQRLLQLLADVSWSSFCQLTTRYFTVIAICWELDVAMIESLARIRGACKWLTRVFQGNVGGRQLLDDQNVPRNRTLLSRYGPMVLGKWPLDTYPQRPSGEVVRLTHPTGLVAAQHRRFSETTGSEGAAYCGESSVPPAY